MRLIKTAAKLQNIRRVMKSPHYYIVVLLYYFSKMSCRNYPFLCVILLIIFLSSCKSGVPFSEKDFNISDSRGSLSYKVSKSGDKKAVLVIPDNPDSLKFFQSELAKALDASGYRIIFPGKAGASDPYLWRTIDNKTDRVDDLVSLVQSEVPTEKTDASSLIVIGFGEGAYLSLAVSNILQPSHTILVNAGPHSPYSELVAIAEKGKFSDQQNEVFPLLNVPSAKVLKERVEYIKEGPGYESSLLNGTNNYYLSYFNNPLLNDFFKNKNEVLWITSEEYFLLSEESKIALRSLVNSRPKPKAKYYNVPGNGNFNRKQEDEALTEIIMGELKARH